MATTFPITEAFEIRTPAAPNFSITDGFALCTPSGTLLGHTYRSCSRESIASVFGSDELGRAEWLRRQIDGWKVVKVMSRITELPS